jgi:hypothetical protein
MFNNGPINPFQYDRFSNVDLASPVSEKGIELKPKVIGELVLFVDGSGA